MKKLLLLIVLFTNFVQASTAAETAQVVSPYQVIEVTGNNLFTKIANKQDALKKFPDLMRDIVEEELMPSVDYQYAAFKILGKHLKNTTKEQRVNFISAMRSYLVRTYANALMQYSNQKVLFEPEGKLKDNAKSASVDVKIIDTGKPDINITFQMRKDTQSQEWKAYDMIVEGISLISSKQAEVNRRISDLGLDQVTLELASIAS
ncbi:MULTISPECIES: ABC transporter substrate-binding protein [unclassified Colwellia]|jgi:phospholipid transport system substrate-binding protein|uniref:MlaC/ttg2D family ABC transporter substrate-binding protein n=1 Tax=unclassified Colwellia TaxID=196834 RepID=UPI000D36DAD8|nr:MULTISPECIES: ABC transporter substrate-binding protein [unclassified Colwellia]AWB56833.1 toluene tolerance protein [Colwellia sp. Arc7-D]MBA6415584.1 ABC transporter substrate-binding protein [Colwellia sp. 6M3]|tara:strand:- start:1654 stop:2268 length:615 start_codon:yes stop_codon:yes gene_type:complete